MILSTVILLLSFPLLLLLYSCYCYFYQHQYTTNLVLNICMGKAAPTSQSEPRSLLWHPPAVACPVFDQQRRQQVVGSCGVQSKCKATHGALTGFSLSATQTGRPVSSPMPPAPKPRAPCITTIITHSLQQAQYVQLLL